MRNTPSFCDTASKVLPAKLNTTGLAEPEEVRVVAVSDGVLQALRVPPEAGRWLLPGDYVPHGQRDAGSNQQRYQGDDNNEQRVVR